MNSSAFLLFSLALNLYHKMFLATPARRSTTLDCRIYIYTYIARFSFDEMMERDSEETIKRDRAGYMIQTVYSLSMIVKSVPC